MNSEHGLHATAERFYAATMLAIWAHSDEASYCDTRGEIVVGWHALEAYWRQAASSNAAFPVKLTATGQIKHAG